MGNDREIDLSGPFINRRVAVTGGTSGLGLALVRELRRRGARVAFVARSGDRVERVAREHDAYGIVGDVSKRDDIYPIAMQIVGRLGGLDVLINNASDLGPTPLALLADTDCEDLERALATNLLGPFRLTKALLGALAASARDGRGALVANISSDAAVAPYPRWATHGNSTDSECKRSSFAAVSPAQGTTPSNSAGTEGRVNVMLAPCGFRLCQNTSSNPGMHLPTFDFAEQRDTTDHG